MNKILWGVFMLGAMFSIISYSNAQDAQREVSYNKCESIFVANHMPQESKQGFLMACMN